MQQLPLDVRLRDSAVFATWFTGNNGALVHHLEAVATDADAAMVWLWSARGHGKTHLLQACVNQAALGDTRCIYLPMLDAQELSPGVLEGLESYPLVCLDDVDLVAGNDDWERALFVLYEGIRAAGGRLVVSATTPPSAADFQLADLASRMASGATFRIQPPSDDDRIAALRLRAEWRGLELPDSTAAYLLRRVPRDNATLFALLDELDTASLVSRRRLTVPLVRSVIEGA